MPILAAKYFYRQAVFHLAGGYKAAAHRNFARAARAGFAPAQFMLARAYQTGEGCSRSGALAKHWYHIAAESGHVDSQFELGLILLNRHDLTWAAGSSATWLGSRFEQERSLAEILFPSFISIESDLYQGFKWLLNAAEAGKPEAQANVGWLLLRGTGCDMDRAEAHRWLTASAAHEISQAALGLAEYYGDNDALQYDPQLSAHWAAQASRLGNGSGSWRYGKALRDGVGILKNETDALKHFALAADQGHLTAGYDWAVLMITREPNLVEFQSIIERLRQCAKGQHLPAALLLADLYGGCAWMQPDLREVAHWYRLAANVGDPQAQFMLACLYARGDGVVRDLQQAGRYFELAAKSGHVQAAFNLGIFLLNGQGFDRSIPCSKKWLKIAADTGFAPAQLRLGQILKQEAASPEEVASAHTLIEQAADAGSVEAKLALARLLLSTEQGNYEQKAFSLLKEAVEGGDVEACELSLLISSSPDLNPVLRMLQKLIQNGNVRAKVVLAEALLSNERLSRDPARAIILLKESAAAGNAQAYFLIGVLYCQGEHFVKDLAKGFSNYSMAAHLNHPLAQYNTGVMLLNGIGTDKNAEEAIAWIRLASNNKVDQAIKLMRNIECKALSAGVSEDIGVA